MFLHEKVVKKLDKQKYAGLESSLTAIDEVKRPPRFRAHAKVIVAITISCGDVDKARSLSPKRSDVDALSVEMAWMRI